MKKQSITLTLQDGSSLTGKSFGAFIESEGEVVFTTGMVGYPESLTDPSFKDQILVLTYPLVGNYGVPFEKLDEYNLSKWFESLRIHIKGLIVEDYSEIYSHWNANKSLADWLKEYNIPGITGIDTRALTQKLRDEGSMLGKIHDANHKPDTNFYDPNTENLVAKVSCKDVQSYGDGEKHIAILDTGIKTNILRSFLKRGVKITVFPWNQSPFDYEKSNNMKFDGYFFANGPGDPKTLDETVNIMREALNQTKPVFGICLGNQIMGRAVGAKTYKLPYGHRGQNQACIDLRTGRCYITSQNHGYAVDPKKLPKDWAVWFENANDGSVEGLRHKSKPHFSVQFHPEACPGPTDTDYLFDEFIALL